MITGTVNQMISVLESIVLFNTCYFPSKYRIHVLLFMHTRNNGRS